MIDMLCCHAIPLEVLELLLELQGSVVASDFSVVS